MTPLAKVECAFLRALSGPIPDLGKAHRCLKRFRLTCEDVQHIRLLELSLDWRKTRRYAYSLRRLFRDIIDQPVKDSLVYARSLVTVSEIHIYEAGKQTEKLMTDTDVLAREFFDEFTSPELSALVYIHNRAFQYWRMGELDKAERLLDQILLRNDVGSIPWKAKASILAGLIATQHGAFQGAIWHLKLAEKISNACEDAWRIYARAKLMQARRGSNLRVAAVFHTAFHQAREIGDCFLMCESLAALGQLYVEAKEFKTAWYSYQLYRMLRTHFGVPQHAALESLTEKVPKREQKGEVSLEQILPCGDVSDHRGSRGF